MIQPQHVIAVLRYLIDLERAAQAHHRGAGEYRATWEDMQVTTPLLVGGWSQKGKKEI